MGEITGAKTIKGDCAKMKTTPVASLEITNDFFFNKAFSYFLNYKDLYSYNDATSPSGKIRYYKGYSDRFRSATVMSGGLNYCLETMKMVDALAADKQNYPIDVANFRRAQAYNCAAQYIGLHSITPWFVYESSGSPLAPLAGDVNTVAYQFCQPLMRGNDVDLLMSDTTGTAKEKNLEMAPVFSSNSPIINENEYLASTYLSRALNNTFGSVALSNALNLSGNFYASNASGVGSNTYERATKDPLGGGVLGSLISEEDGKRLLSGINLACVTPKDIDEYWDWGTTVDVVDPGVTPPPSPSGDNVCPVPPSPGSPGPGPGPSQATCPLYVESPGALIIQPQPVFKEYYCPNVESIKDATHPFSPRNDMTGRTDRDYSERTSVKYNATNGVKIYACNYKQGDPPLNINEYGYTNYNNPDHVFWGVNQDPIRAPKRKLRFPPVQCAVVPVDILRFRADAFDACIMQRINYNMADWTLNKLKLEEAARTGKPNGAKANWKPPCATKYFETDEVGGKSTCPVKYSIQQCCSIITKPVVPMNHLKIRTVEGIFTMNDKDRMDTRSGNGDDIKRDVFVEDRFLQLPFAPEPLVHPDTPVVDPYLITAKKIEKRRIGMFHSKEPLEYHFFHWFGELTLSGARLPYEDPGNPDNPNDPNDEPGAVGYHMPYMRWWDTGTAAGNGTGDVDGSINPAPWKYGSFINTLGGWDTIVGVGREGRDKDEADRTEKRAEIFKWTTNLGNLGTSERQAGNLGGWDELVLHQLYTMRFHNLNCIGRYEKLFKDGDADNYVHYAAGGSFTNPKGQSYPWPLGWRGYASNPNDFQANRQDLDTAAPGDIAFLVFDGVRTPVYIENIGFPPEFEAKIKAMAPADRFLYNEAAGRWEIHAGGINGPVTGFAHPNRVYVSAWNYGKFPDSTGITNQWGTGPTRVIFRDHVPTTYLLGNDPKLLAAKVPLFSFSSGQIINWQPACNDPDYTVCVLPRDIIDWKATQLYRARYDIKDCGVNFGPPSASNTVSAAAFAQCIAQGFDPPLAYRSGAGTAIFTGAGTGAVTRTSYCGPAWGTCNNSGVAPVPPPKMRW